MAFVYFFFGAGLCVVVVLLLSLLLFRSHWKRYAEHTIERRQWAPCRLNHNISIMNKDPKKKRIIQFVVASLLKMFQTDYRRCVGTKRIPSSYSFVFHSLLFTHSTVSGIFLSHFFITIELSCVVLPLSTGKFRAAFYNFQWYRWQTHMTSIDPECLLIHKNEWEKKTRTLKENQSERNGIAREKSVIYNILVCLNGITLPMNWRHFVSRWD